MDATSSADLVHTQVHPRRPWRTQGPRPSVRGSNGRRRKKRQLLQAPDIRPDPRQSGAHHRRHPKLNQVSPDIRPPGPDIRPVTSRRTSGPAPGNPAPHHRSWTLPARTSGPSARTSGPLCLRAAHPVNMQRAAHKTMPPAANRLCPRRCPGTMVPRLFPVHFIFFSPQYFPYNHM